MLSENEILGRFRGVKGGRGQYTCKCPAHDDVQCSLSICFTTNKKTGLPTTLFKCFAGCDLQEILDAASLTMADIQESPARPTWQQKMAEYYEADFAAEYSYHDERGVYLYSKIRMKAKADGKKVIRYAQIDRAADRYSICKKADLPKVLYRLPQLLQALSKGRPVYLVEGEKDCDNLRSHGLTATTAGGVNDWQPEFARYFRGATVYILPDNDEPGRKLAEEVKRDLRRYAHCVKVVPTSDAEKGDVSDYLDAGGTVEDLQNLVSEAEPIYAPWISATITKGRTDLKVNADLLAQAFAAGNDYLVVRRMNDERDDVYYYACGVYERRNANAFKAEIRRYLPRGLASKNLLDNVFSLLLCEGGHLHAFEDLDADERYLNFRNGLYNLNTRQLEPHRPDVLSTWQLQCNYEPRATACPSFTRFIDDFCRDGSGAVKADQKNLLQEYAGMVLSNVPVYRTKKSLVLWSSLGNTGKSAFLRLITSIIGGDRIVNLPLQGMREDNRFGLGGLPGKRLIVCGDQTAEAVQDASVFKQLTGGDAVRVEPKGKMPVYLVFRGGVMIACNNLPMFADDKGGHVFERMLIAPCENHVPERARDPAMLDKMLQEREAVANWCLAGLHRLIESGYRFTECEAGRAAMNEYRARSDTVFDFLQARYEITGEDGDREAKADLDSEYMRWCAIQDRKPVSKNNLAERMAKNGVPCRKGNLGSRRGVMVYIGLRPRPEDFGPVPPELEARPTDPAKLPADLPLPVTVTQQADEPLPYDE